MDHGTSIVFSPTAKVATAFIGAGVSLLVVEVLGTERGYGAVTDTALRVVQSDITRQVAQKAFDAFFERLQTMGASPLSH